MEPDLLRTVSSKVQIERVIGRISLLADKARDTAGGVSRLAFSSAEAEGLALVARWMEEAGLTVAYDALGNMFGSTDGNSSGVRVLMAGSHLDSVPNGGAYDGVLGVIGAIEAVEAARAAGVKSAVPMEVVVWRCEEAALFGQGRLGSLFLAGELSLNTVRQWEKADLPLDRYLQDAARLPQRAGDRSIGGYLELHIEQGRRLEASNTTIGAVTAIPGATRWRIGISGRADHSGATPMGMRRDALAAAAELILAVERAGMAERTRETVATAAAVRALPGAWNVIPGQVELLTDIRGIEQESIDRALEFVREAARGIASQREVEISFEDVTRGKPVLLNEAMVSRVESAARALNMSVVRMPSGAGHDAQTIAPLAPTGMVFVPSIGGVSHSPQEFTRPEDILAGVQVLAGTWAALAVEGGSR